MRRKRPWEMRCLRGVLLVASVGLCLAESDYSQSSDLPAEVKEARERYPIPNRDQFIKRVAPEGDLYGNIPADRALRLRDMDLLLELADFLVDKRNAEVVRTTAAGDLGRLGHRDGIPSLLAVMRDENESRELRRNAVTALSKIQDELVVQHLLDAIADEQLSGRASGQLWVIMGRPGELLGVRGSKEQHQQRWRAWWKANREKVELNRETALRSANRANR